ncbi:putative coiled-coil protein SlyX [Dysgonomonas hofstadii]|uniref:Putative coiled-coil protein SlyX n=1 Tax=Dysgonomonas hofstadii TaxID=637886 RepID=A0A840CZN4_9BACT|nr:BfmA/BtgA family mobilization protein [Dysgonomonas hofstadii]MBB4037453.1 putative coiled-coil protein SlyX [Dysgonomonas hofstadii]
MEGNKNKSVLTTIGIDKSTNRLIDKLSNRYNLKKGEIVKLAFEYMDKACINPSEPPESVKTEMAKINKRQDDLIRFIRHFEEEQLNPMIRATHSIAIRFDGIVKDLETLVLSQLENNHEKYNTVLQKISDTLTQHADVINNQGKQINSLHQLLKQDNKKLLELIGLYAELTACGVMDGKRKENLKAEIYQLINAE